MSQYNDMLDVLIFMLLFYYAIIIPKQHPPTTSSVPPPPPRILFTDATFPISSNSSSPTHRPQILTASHFLEHQPAFHSHHYHLVKQIAQKAI